MKTRKKFINILYAILIGAGLVTNIFLISTVKAEDITLDYSFNEPIMENIYLGNNTTGGVYTRINLDNLPRLDESLSNLGYPAIPYKRIYVLLSQNHSLGSINITVAGKTNINGSYVIEPIQKSTLQFNKTEEFVPPNSTIYNQETPYPSINYTNQGNCSIRGYKTIILDIYPVHYVPDEKKIYYYKYINFTISPTENSTNDPLFRGTEHDENIVKSIVENPSLTSTYTSGPPSFGTTYEYVVITTEDYYNNFKNLTNWKETRGQYTDLENLSTKIVNVSDITDNSSFWVDGPWGDNNSTYWGGPVQNLSLFNDTACKIRNFIRYSYMETGTEFIVLGGDSDGNDDIVPVRVLQLSSNITSPGDVYYSNIDGNWNENENEKWGQIGVGENDDDMDINCDVFVGRFPVDNSTEAWAMVNKTIAYENSSISTDEYLWKSLLIAGPNLGTTGYQLDRNIEFIPQYSSKKMYDKDGQYSKQNIKSILQQGDAHIVLCNSHGSSGSMGSISKSDIKDFNNNDKYYCIFVDCCYTARFNGNQGSPDGDCIAEHFVVEPNSGAFAYIGSAGTGAAGFYTYDCCKSVSVDNRLGYIISTFRNYGPNDNNADAKKINLLGDPEIRIKKDLPVPTARIEPSHDYPLFSEIIHGNVTINGTAIKGELPGSSFSYYEISYGAGQYPTSWMTTGLTLNNNGNQEINNSVLGYWNTTYVTDGHYTLNLTVYNGSNIVTSDYFQVTVRNDLSVHNLNLSRNYTSIYDAIQDVSLYKGENYNNYYITIDGDCNPYCERIEVNSLSTYNITIMPGDDETPSFNMTPVSQGNLFDLNGGIKDIAFQDFVFTNPIEGTPFYTLYSVNRYNHLYLQNCTFTSGTEVIFKRMSGEISNCTSDNAEKLFFIPEIKHYGTPKLCFNHFDCESLGLKVNDDAVIHHNNFVWNSTFSISSETQNATFDNGSVGNYWCTYNGKDNDYDNIGDQPFEYTFLDNTFIDNYPIMHRWNHPFALFEHEPVLPDLSEKVYLNSSSFDLFGSISNWTWIFEDETVQYGERIEKQFPSVGLYNVTLNVTDNDNNRTNITRCIAVGFDENCVLSESWNLIGVSYDESVSKTNISFLYNKNVCNWSNAVYSDLISQYIFIFNTSTQTYNFTEYFEPGHGHWFYVYEDCKIIDQLGDSQNDETICNLANNWNLISLPFDQSVDKNDILINISNNLYSWSDAVSAGYINNYIFGWNKDIKSYSFNDVLEPGYGYWMYAYTPCILMVDKSLGGGNDTANDSIIWQVELNITETYEDLSSVIIFGENPDASDGTSADTYDAPAPPTSPEPYLYAYFDDNLPIPTDKLIGDYRTWTDSEKTWNLTITYTSNNQSYTFVNLSWNISLLMESEYDTILLFDNSTNSSVNMLTQAYYQYNMTVNTSNDFQILCTNGSLPIFENVTTSPSTGGFGENITISADVYHLFNNISTVKVNVTNPDNTTNNFTMTNTFNNTYQYGFDDTWQTGTYQYRVWAMDTEGNISYSDQYDFDVVANASIQVCTVKNTYTSANDINVTDPPSSPIMSDIGYELLDNNQVLHIWNLYDSYYFDTDSGIQLTNHKDEYWSDNVLMLGYYNNDNWNLIYRTDELSGFQKSVETDNQTYVNATLWKDLTYQGYEFRLALRYHLGLEDNELTISPYIENLGDPIPYTLGFAWEINDIRIDDTPEGDYILINDSHYWLNESLDLSFTNLSKPVYCWNETLNDSVFCGYEPIPYFHVQENISDNAVKSLYLRWDPDLNYKVWIQSQNDSYNAPIMLGIQIGTLDSGESKQTSLYWYDADQQVFYYDTNSPFETWSSNPGYMVDNNTATFASTSTENDVEKCTGNSCPDIDPGKISKVEIRAYAKRQGGKSSILLRPVFKSGDGDNHEFELSPSAGWSDWYDITEDTNAPSWTWKDVTTFDCDVEAYDFDPLFGSNPHCGKVEIRVTYSPWTPPSITNPTPGYGSTNVSIQPQLGITVSDDNGDELDISWLSNCSGSWQEFVTNNSVGNGTYYQTMNGANVNGQWWYWRLNVSDDHDYNLSSVFKFYTGTQSKLVNTGNTDIKGHLLMQVEFWNGTSWITDQVVIDDSSPRSLNASGVLGLDTVFNGLLDTGDLHYGDGDYRMYVALCDPYGEVLVASDSELEAWWRFEVDLL